MSESVETAESTSGPTNGATNSTPAEKPALPADITQDEREDYERTGSLELYELRREDKRREEAAKAAAAEEQKRILREKLNKTDPKTGLALPPDMTEMERKDYERTGSLEMYELGREADKVQREAIKVRQELAEREQAEAHKSALRQQALLDKHRLEAERARLALPPPPDPYADSKPIPGSERLPEPVKAVLRRLFGYGSWEWTEANQVGLVNLLIAMGNHKAQAWAFELRDALAADVYHSHDLSPRALLQGSTGLKAIAGPHLMGELKALAGGDTGLKALADEQHERKPAKTGGKKRKQKGTTGRDGVVRVKATRIREEQPNDDGDDESEDEETIDDSPNQDAEKVHDPWGEYD